MLCKRYSSKIVYDEFHRIYLRGDIKLLLVNVNNRLTLEIEIVHDLSCHPIVTMVLSCTVSEIWRLIGYKLPIFPSLSHSVPSLPRFPLEFRAEVNHEETRVMGLSSREDPVIVA